MSVEVRERPGSDRGEQGRIGEMLLAARIITEEQLRGALMIQEEDGCRLGSALVKIGAIDEDVLATFLGMQRGTETISLSKRLIPPDVISLVSMATAYRYGAIPVARSAQVLNIVLVDPEDREALAVLRKETGLEIRAQIAPQTSIYAALKRLYPTDEAARPMDPERRGRIRLKIAEARRLIEEIESEITG